MADQDSAKEYWADVRGVVQSFRETCGEFEGNEEEAWRWLHETIDGHQRVIYTGKAIACLLYCGGDNHNAHTEEFGEAPLLENGNLNWSGLAFSAFQRDIHEQMSAEGIDINDPETWQPKA